MPTNKPEASNFYVVARAVCRGGKVKCSRKERVTFALVELRDRIKEEFLRVAKDWQVSAAELRRDYSYAYPASAPGAPDLLCLEQGCEWVMNTLRWEIQTTAEQHGVPGDLLERLLVDWLVADQMGLQRTPTALFAMEAKGKSQNYAGDEESRDRLPVISELLRRKLSKGNGSTGATNAKASAPAPRMLLGQVVVGQDEGECPADG